MGELLRVEGLTKVFPITYNKAIVAVNNISFGINEQETFGLIGESGSGKSTVGRCLLNLIKPTSGELYYNGKEYSRLPQKQRRDIQREMQMVFQDPNYSLNPRRTVWDTLMATLKANKAIRPEERKEKAVQALEYVQIKEDEYGKYAHQLSMGQQQRVGIARAIAAHPNFIVLDEPTSSLDVSIRAEIIDLLKHLQKTVGMSYLFISHDLSTIRFLCHRVAVMYLGTIMEYGTVDQLFNHYAHPYSKALLSSVMIADPNVKNSNYKLKGEIPSSINLGQGCPLASRCQEAEEKCFSQTPPMVEIQQGHFVKCFHVCAGCKGCASQAGENPV